ncbi:response regulator transcription factor [Roseivirga echinicomitans]
MKKILLVEDNAIILDNVSEILGLEGYHVIAAKNGVEGLSLAKSKKPDLILSDIDMPLMNGYQMLKEIRSDAEMQEIPIVFLSVKNYGQELVHGLQFGADAYICKPFDLTELLEAVEKHLKK